MYDNDDYDDNRKIQPQFGTRKFIPGSDEQFDEMGFSIDPSLGAEEEDGDG